MLRILALGVPAQIRVRLENQARKNGVYVASIFCDVDKYGALQLLPTSKSAIHHLRTYYEDDAFKTSYEDALVIVFPYAEVPEQMHDELLIIEELGGQVVFTKAGTNGWPEIPGKRRKGRDSSFFDAVFNAACGTIFGPHEVPVSEIFLKITGFCPKIIVTQRALDSCDQIAKHRVSFIEASALALVDFIENDGSSGRIDAFFRDRGIEHAQTGGIQTTLTIRRGGRCVYQSTAHTHLKKGDKTTPQAAARVYYHLCCIENERYIAVVYAGPHPESDITSEHLLAD